LNKKRGTEKKKKKKKKGSEEGCLVYIVKPQNEFKKNETSTRSAGQCRVLTSYSVGALWSDDSIKLYYATPKERKQEGIPGKSSSFFSHPLDKTPIVEAPPSHIGIKFFQGIRQSSILSVLEESVSKHVLSINFLHAI